MKRKERKTSNRGFTLIELLVVIGIIAILAAIVIVAVNPSRQFRQARNAQRWSDVNALLNALHQYAVDNNGNLPSGLGTDITNVKIIGTGNSTACSAITDKSCAGYDTIAGCLDLDAVLVGSTQKYLTQIPTDPTAGTAVKTNYYAYITSGRRVEVGACYAEEDATISVTR